MLYWRTQDCPFCLKIHARKGKKKFWKEEEGVKTDRKEERRDRVERAEGESNDYNVLSRSFVLYG